jgi:hypothetical protein
MKADMKDPGLLDAMALLEAHYYAFFSACEFAEKTGHPVPCDTRAWSQILVSLLTGIKGRDRGKGSDLIDGSDVKAANCWKAIDTPRFNGAIPSGRISETSRKSLDVSALDDTPFIFFVLWDEGANSAPRCRGWCVRANKDKVFRRMCAEWYSQRASGQIKSDNFQLHPPRFRDDNVFRNKCGNLSYPLLFSAMRSGERFSCVHYDKDVLVSGACSES